MSGRDINIKLLMTAFVDKAAGAATKAMTTIRSQVDMVDQKLVTHNKMVRRMADNNKKAFNLAALSTGPLIRAYAEVAASMWAIERTWSAVELGAKFEETATSFEVLSKTFGFSSQLIISNLRSISGETVTTNTLMKNASLALSSGIDPKQLEGLTKVARQAARAMGRTLPDAYDRIIKAVTKLEPELLDEIGITTRLQNILGDYAKSVGKTVDQITSLEKTQIFTNAVLAEGAKKFGSINTEVASLAERMSKLKSDMVNFFTDMSAGLAHAIVPLAEGIASISAFLIAGSIAWASYRASLLFSAKAATAASAAEVAYISAKNADIIATENLAIAEVALATAKDRGVASTSRATLAINVETAAKRRTAAAEELAKRTAGRSGTIVNKGLSKTFGLLARGIPILGTVVTAWMLFGPALASAAESLGLVDKATDSTENKLKLLNKRQKSLIKNYSELGVSQDQIIESLLLGKTATTELEGSYKLLTSSVRGSNGEMQTYTRVLGLLPQTSTDAMDSLKTLETHIKSATAATGWFGTLWDNVTRGVTANSKDLVVGSFAYAQAQKELVIAQKEAVASVVAQDSANKKVLSSVGTLDNALGKIGVTMASLMASSPEEKIKKLSETIAHYKKITYDSIDTSAAPSVIQQLVDDIEKGKKALPGMIALLEKLKSTQNKKSNKKITKSAISASESGAGDLVSSLGASKAEQTQVLADSKDFHLRLLEAQGVYFAEKQARALTDAENNAINETQLAARLLTIDQDSNKARAAEDKDFTKRTLKLQKSKLNAIASNEDVDTADRVGALKQRNDIILASKKLSVDEQLLLVKAMNAKIKDLNDKETLKTGSIFDILALRYNDAAEKMLSTNDILATGFEKVGTIITDVFKDKLLVGLGLATDAVKTKFQEQLQAAQASYQGMVAAANAAFSGDVASVDKKSFRAKQDLETSRVRKISDLTAGRNSGSITDQGFQKGANDLSLSVRRKTEDINLTNSRGKEDAGSKKASSLLDAQKKLNEQMLAANQEFAASNQTIWDDMYGAIKGTAISTLTDIMKAEFSKNNFSLSSLFDTENKKLVGQAEGATKAGLIEKGKSAQSAVLAGPGIMAQFSAMIPPPFGQIAAGVAIAGIMALVTKLTSKVFSAGSVTAPALSAPKFHTGGTLGGTSEEIPFIGLKGEGILNRHNGMKAIGGSKGLDRLNSTGNIGSTGGITNVTIEVKSASGETTGSLTINNFEDFLRNQGGKQMRKVSRDGIILVNARGIV